VQASALLWADQVPRWVGPPNLTGKDGFYTKVSKALATLPA